MPNATKSQELRCPRLIVLFFCLDLWVMGIVGCQGCDVASFPSNGVFTVVWFGEGATVLNKRSSTKTTHAPALHSSIAAASESLLPTARKIFGFENVLGDAHDGLSAITARI